MPIVDPRPKDWRENVRIVLDTGFRDKNGSISTEGTLRADNFLYSFGGDLQFQRVGRPGRLRLVKLHGSTTWLIRKDTGEIEEKPFDIDQGADLGTGSMYKDEVVIYPLRQKHGKKMILIHPHPEEIKKRFPAHEDEIIVIKKYFGRNGDQEVINNTIKEELKRL